MPQLVEYTEPQWRDLNLRDLKVDEAYLYLRSFYEKATYLYTLSAECYKCPYTKVRALKANSSKAETLRLNVAHALKFKLFNTDLGRYAFDNETALCELEPDYLQEFGIYNLTLQRNGTCQLATDKAGVNIYWPMLSVFLLLGVLMLFIKVSLCAWRSYHYDEVLATAEPATEMREHVETPQTSKPQRRRMNSLDTFRGMAIVLMIFVNSGGGNYWWIEHAPWNGLHLADIVFPSFLWIMGVCIPISVRSQLGHNVMKTKICRRILLRSIKLFIIGIFLNSVYGTPLERLRIMGVLQRFGVAFLACGVLHTLFAKGEHLMPQVRWKRAVQDLILFRGEFLVILALIATHLAIIFALPVPDCPKGYLGPGGKYNYASYPNCIGGATGYIDLKLLGNSHIYQHPTAKYIYDSGAFDPEGIFGCLLTIVQVLLGLLAGIIILTHTAWRSRIKRWLIWSVVLAILGGVLCMFSKEEGPLPINKNLWSLSFVFATSALAFLLLSVLYFVIDVQQWWTGFPFLESGKNAIVMYVGHTIMHRMLPWHWQIGAMNTHFVLLLEAVWNTTLWVGIALYLDKKHFYYSL